MNNPCKNEIKLWLSGKGKEVIHRKIKVTCTTWEKVWLNERMCDLEDSTEYEIPEGIYFIIQKDEILTSNDKLSFLQFAFFFSAFYSCNENDND